MSDRRSAPRRSTPRSTTAGCSSASSRRPSAATSARSRSSTGCGPSSSTSAACGCSCSRRRTCAPADGSRARRISSRSGTPISTSCSAWCRASSTKVQSLPELVDVTTDREQNGLQANVVIDRPGGRAARRAHPGHRQRAQQCVLAAADFDHLLRPQPVPRHPRSRSAASSAIRPISTQVYVAGAGNTQVPLSSVARIEKIAGAAGHQPPGLSSRRSPSPTILRRTSRSRQASRRDRAGGRRAAPAGHAAHRIRRRRAGLPALGRRAAAGDPGGAAGGLHHPRRAVREPGASADHHLDAAVRRPRRAAGVAAVPRRADGDRLHRHHPADRHRQEERHHDGGLRAWRRARSAGCRRRRRSARRAWRASARS